MPNTKTWVDNVGRGDRTRGRHEWSALCLSLVLSLAACAEEPPPAPWTATDSAGAILLSGPLPAETFATVDPSPLLHITEADGTPLFRVAAVVPAPTGGLLVLDGGNHRTLLFDDAGALRASGGGQGDGPGEFQLPMVATPSDGNVLVYDRRHGRVSMLDAELHFLRAHTLEPAEGSTPPQFHAALPSGLWVASTGQALRGVPQSGILRRPSQYIAYSPGDSANPSESSPPFFEGLGPERWVAIQMEGGQIVSANIVGYPFFRNTVMSVSGNMVAIGDTDMWCVSVFSGEGTLLRRYCADEEPRPFGPREIDTYLNTLTDLTAAERRARGESLADVELPPSLPAYSELQIDDEGRVWVRAFSMDPLASQVWTVLDESGAVGTVTLPPRFALRTISRDRAYGVHRDDFDVESVRVHALSREGR